jgi:hypothetical protein
LASSWLPEAVPAAAAGRRPWAPKGVPALPDRCSYIVVEEIIGGSIGLAVCDWPELDEQGRMRFADPAQLAGVDRTWLEQQLIDHREPADIAKRELRIGDVFAVADVELALAPGESELTIASWKPPIYDVTGEARAAAKTALYGAVAPVLDSEQARDLEELIEEVEG